MSLLHRFRPYMRGEGLILTGGMAALIAATAMKLLEPWPLKFVVDSVLRVDQPTDATTVIALCAGAFIAITALRAVFQFMATTVFSLVGGRILTRVRADLFAHVQRLSADFHEKSRAGDIMLRLVGDVGMLKDTAVSATLPLLGNVLVLTGMIGVMLWLDWRLALVALIPLPLLWLATRHVSARIGQASRAQRKREGAIAATAGEALAGMRAIQALGLESAVARMFSGANERSLTDGVRSGRLSAGLERMVDAMVGIATAAILWFGAHAVISGRLTPGELLVFLTYLKNTFRPVREYAKYSGRLAKAAAAGERVFDLLDQVPSVQDRPDAVDAPTFRGEIDLRDVHFGYGDRTVLAGLGLTIPAGQSVAITGPSGIGKSTLLTLLLRLRDPVSGTLHIDGTDIGAVTLASLRRQISFVAQEPLLFSSTVAENIALGAGRDVSRAQIEAAARLADAHGFIAALPDGYDTVVAERGANFSAGQRQRLAIARAALRQAPILMMDEPTAGLDSASEDAVANAIDALAKGRTTLLVTHNLSLAARMDRIIVLSGGQVAEDGTHEALLAKGGRYAALWRLQGGCGMLQPADLDIVVRDPALPGLALVLDVEAVSTLLGVPVEPAHLRYKPGVSCMATFRTGSDFVTLRALTRQRFAEDELSPRRSGLVRLVPEHAVMVMPPAADRRITAMRRGVDLGAAAPLRFKPERRMVLRQGDAMIKAMSRATWTRALSGARFGATRGGPQVLSVDEKHRLIATQWLAGRDAEGGGPDTFARIGTALAELHRSKADLPARKPVRPPAALSDLARLLPELTDRIHHIRTALALSLHQGPLVPCHGDFSADQVIVASDGTLSIIDWDEAGMADPASDLGSFLARLDHDLLTGTPTQDAAKAFLRGYGAPPAGLAAHHAAALAALATEGFRTRRTDWPELARRLLDRIAQILPPQDPLHIAADPVAMTRLSGLQIGSARMTRFKAGKRALFVYDDALVGKMRFKGADRMTPDLHDRLRKAGLDGLGDTGIPQQRGAVDALHLWLQDLVPGRLLTDLIAPAGPQTPFHAAGKALARLHSADVRADRNWTLADELAVMRKALDQPALRGLCERLTASVGALPRAPTCGIHRDFYPDQVLIDDGRVWLLDLDLYANGDPAVDLGNFLAHLDEFALRQGWGCAALAPQGDAFLAGYASLRALPAHVAQLRAVSLARHIRIAASFPDRQHTPPLILAYLESQS